MSEKECEDEEHCPTGNPDGNTPVPERLCKARRETMEEKIDSVRKAIYLSGLILSIIIIVINFVPKGG